MGWTVNNFPIRVILEVIMEGIGDIINTDGEVVVGINGNNQPCYS